jgi:hypothetical protein
MKTEDLEKYLQFYDDFDMTHEQKIEHIQALYNVVTHFVDAAFDQPDQSEHRISECNR